MEIRDAGGITDMPAFLAALTNVAGFNTVTRLGIVRDCETDPAQAFRDVCAALRGASLPAPAAVLQGIDNPPAPHIIVMLLPDAQTPGMLETLCWRSLAGDARLPCIEDFLDCIAKAVDQPVPRIDKSRLHAYIASRENPWLLLGQAARARYFPWDSAVFDDVKQFLRALVGGMP